MKSTLKHSLFFAHLFYLFRITNPIILQQQPINELNKGFRRDLLMKSFYSYFFEQLYSNLTIFALIVRSITAKDFLTAVRKYLHNHREPSAILQEVISCKRDETIKDIILRLDSAKIHRIYVVDEDDGVEGVITLRDIISKLVHEPRHYFGDFFDGVVPLPENSRV